MIPVDDAPDSLGGATITTDGDGASGAWSSTHWSFTGTPDLSRYTVTVDNDLLDIHGILTLDSVRNLHATLSGFYLPTHSPLLNRLWLTYFLKVAPAHYPCGPNESGQNLEVSPQVGWADAIPMRMRRRIS